jgi:hypothetical protein
MPMSVGPQHFLFVLILMVGIGVGMDMNVLHACINASQAAPRMRHRTQTLWTMQYDLPLFFMGVSLQTGLQ